MSGTSGEYRSHCHPHSDRGHLTARYLGFPDDASQPYTELKDLHLRYQCNTVDNAEAVGVAFYRSHRDDVEITDAQAVIVASRNDARVSSESTTISLFTTPLPRILVPRP
jgi:hypothetical protein